MAKKIRLLFVDDDQEFLRKTSRQLAAHELAVDTFTGGAEALAAAADGAYDIALIDLRMPGMDGQELLEKLRERHPSMEVVILTAVQNLETAVECARMGAFEYLEKPCNLDEILEALNNAYVKHIQAGGRAKIEKIQQVLSHAVGLSPAEILEELRKIDRE